MDARPDRTAVVELVLRLPTHAICGRGSSAAEGSDSVGREWHEVVLSVAYRVAFVGVFDHAPDASRGVDIPPAVATLLPAACANDTGLGDSEPGRSALPLHGRLAGASGCVPVQRYGGAAGGVAGGGCVVALTIPDFSMPFNVACFTSTLLAVLLGGVENVVLRCAAARGQHSGPGWSRRQGGEAVLNARRVLLARHAGRLRSWRAAAAASAAAPRCGAASCGAWWRCWR